MSQTQSTIACSLKRQHHLLWLFLGVGFSLFFCSQFIQQGVATVGVLIGLLAVYCCAGRLAASLVARLAFRSTTSNPATALFSSSVKIGVLFSVLSTLFHLALLAMPNGITSLGVLLQTGSPILLRAAIFPFLACLGAACTISGDALPEEAGMAQFPKVPGYSSLAD